MAQVRQAGYTKSGKAERLAGVALDPLTNFQVAGTLLDGTAARSRLTGRSTSPADSQNGSRE